MTDQKAVAFKRKKERVALKNLFTVLDDDGSSDRHQGTEADTYSASGVCITKAVCHVHMCWMATTASQLPLFRSNIITLPVSTHPTHLPAALIAEL